MHFVLFLTSGARYPSSVWALSMTESLRIWNYWTPPLRSIPIGCFGSKFWKLVPREKTRGQKGSIRETIDFFKLVKSAGRLLPPKAECLWITSQRSLPGICSSLCCDLLGYITSYNILHISQNKFKLAEIGMAIYSRHLQMWGFTLLTAEGMVYSQI